MQPLLAAWPKCSTATHHPLPPLPQPTCHSGTEASDSHRPAYSQRQLTGRHGQMPLQVLGRQAPQQAATLLHQFQSEEPPPSIREAAEAAAQLQQHGFEPPAWDQLMNNPPVPPDPHPHEGPNIMKGWQQGAANACHTTFQAELHSCLDPASQALLESQRGPHASRPFTTIPYHADTTYESHLFRILLLRRLRLPIPLTASHCRCRRALDPYGDHRAACAQSGILRNRAGPLERATARMCREAGARVTTNTLLTNLNI